MQNFVKTNTHSITKEVEEYKKAKLNLDALPQMKKENSFDRCKWQNLNNARIVMDIAMAKVVHLRQEKVKFLHVDNVEGIVAVTYNPYGDTLSNVKGVKYTFTTPVDGKQKFYLKAAVGKIDWQIKTLTGNMRPVFVAKFNPLYIDVKTNKMSMDDFCKTLAVFIRNTPHAEFNSVDVFLSAFFDWFNTVETDAVVQCSVFDSVLDNLKTVIFKDDREKMTKEELESAILSHSLKPKMIDVSKRCNALFEDLKFDHEESRNKLSAIREKARLQMEQMNKQAEQELDEADKEKEEEKPPEAPVESPEEEMEDTKKIVVLPFTPGKPSEKLQKALKKREREEEDEEESDVPNAKRQKK